MAKMRCYDCDAVFDEEDAETRSECVGEFWGSPAYQNYAVCPFCHSEDIEEYEEPAEEEEGEDETE